MIFKQYKPPDYSSRSNEIPIEKRKDLQESVQYFEDLYYKKNPKLVDLIHNKYSKTESLLEKEERKHFSDIEKEDNKHPPFRFGPPPEKVEIKNPVFKIEQKNDVKPPTMTKEQSKSTPFSFGNIESTPFSFGNIDPNIIKSSIPAKE
jgi:hypothetical protein